MAAELLAFIAYVDVVMHSGVESASLFIMACHFEGLQYPVWTPWNLPAPKYAAEMQPAPSGCSNNLTGVIVSMHEVDLFNAANCIHTVLHLLL